MEEEEKKAGKCPGCACGSVIQSKKYSDIVFMPCVVLCHFLGSKHNLGKESCIPFTSKQFFQISNHSLRL